MKRTVLSVAISVGLCAAVAIMSLGRPRPSGAEEGRTIPTIEELERKPFSSFSHSELASFIPQFRARYGLGPGERVGYWAQRCIGMPSSPAPRSNDLSQADCMTFVMRCLALGLSMTWDDYYLLTTRMKYQDGDLNEFKRNQFTELQWIPNNAWILDDMTEAWGGHVTLSVPTPYGKRIKALVAKAS